jgi:hypothetical protein
MKYICSGLLLLSVFTTFAGDKEPFIEKGTHTVGIAYGFPNVIGEKDPRVSIGSVIVTADRQLSKRFNIGLQYNFNYTDGGVRSRTVSNNVSYQSQSKSFLHRVSFNSEYCFINKGRVCLGSGLGVAAGVQKTYYNYSNLQNIVLKDGNYALLEFAFMLRLVDVQVKLKDNLSVTGCLGYGYDGLVTAGVQYTFRRK